MDQIIRELQKITQACVHGVLFLLRFNINCPSVEKSHIVWWEGSIFYFV